MLWSKQAAVNSAEKDLSTYLSVYSKFVNIFTELSKNNYGEALNVWNEWDKSGITLIGLNVEKTTEYLLNLKENRGDRNKNLDALVQNNPSIIDWSLICNIEQNLRNLIKESLEKFFGDEDSAWRKGIPMEIRKGCVDKIEEANDAHSLRWNFFNFSDYPVIIRKKENWNNIFSVVFKTTDKDACCKNRDTLTSFLDTVVSLRNTVMHMRRKLRAAEREVLQDAVKKIESAYQAWRNMQINTDATKIDR